MQMQVVSSRKRSEMMRAAPALLKPPPHADPAEYVLSPAHFRSRGGMEQSRLPVDSAGRARAVVPSAPSVHHRVAPTLRVQAGAAVDPAINQRLRAKLREYEKRDATRQSTVKLEAEVKSLRRALHVLRGSLSAQEQRRRADEVRLERAYQAKLIGALRHENAALRAENARLLGTLTCTTHGSAVEEDEQPRQQAQGLGQAPAADTASGGDAGRGEGARLSRARRRLQMGGEDADGGRGATRADAGSVPCATSHPPSSCALLGLGGSQSAGHLVCYPNGAAPGGVTVGGAASTAVGGAGSRSATSSCSTLTALAAPPAGGSHLLRWACM